MLFFYVPTSSHSPIWFLPGLSDTTQNPVAILVWCVLLVGSSTKKNICATVFKRTFLPIRQVWRRHTAACTMCWARAVTGDFKCTCHSLVSHRPFQVSSFHTVFLSVQRLKPESVSMLSRSSKQELFWHSVKAGDHSRILEQISSPRSAGRACCLLQASF